MPISRQDAEMMIDRYIAEIGLTKEQTYNAEKKAWYWTRGSAGIEAFIADVPVGTGTRQYLRVFSSLMEVPMASERDFYRHLLELNDGKLGVKLTVMPGSNLVFATYERDIVGMDYEELATCIGDLEWWADTLDDQLKAKFNVAGTRPDRIA
ncbi:MAG: YbjN domain-containing protein [Verrucomicrobia bacterium]|nr:YbjN domain-containing protein [Cytophagales bacterium]